MVVSGLGKYSGAKRHQYKKRDSLVGITRPAIKHLANRAGVARINDLVYTECRSALKEFLTQLLKDAMLHTDGRKRKTITGMDVVEAMKRNGAFLYMA